VYSLLIIVLVVLAVFTTWRFASRHRSLPCPVWLRWVVELDNPFTKTNRAAVIIEHLDIVPGMAVLDMGCGPGRVTIPIAEKVGKQGRVVAVDIQAGMLRRAEEKAKKAGVSNIQFLLAGAGEGKLERDVFDRALLVTVLGEIPDRDSAMKEIFDSLKPGGVLSITEIIFDPHFQRRNTVRNIAERIGFREKKFFGNAIAYTMHLEKPTTNHAKH
jgi:ubiquinone/menaquinone biosynthesis C-methylase UbiE